MLVFIDESGIHKQEGKSSVALVCVAADNAEKLNKLILETETKLRISSFHWTHHTWKIRFDFMRQLAKSEFEVRAAIIDNPFDKGKFEEAIRFLLVEKKIRHIVLDGKKPRWYSAVLKKILREKGVSVKKIRTANDQSFPCLRLADAFAGMVRTYWNDPKNEKAKELYKIAHKKITTQLVGGQILG